MPPDPTLVDVTASPPAAALDAIRRSGASRWLLTGPAAAVQAVVEAVLSGEAQVFGLAGVVLTEPVPPGLRELSVPTLSTTAAGLDEAVARFWSEYAGRGPAVPADYAALLASSRVGSRTRAIHARRALADDPDYAPVALSPAELDVLRVVAARVVPQDSGTGTIDLAARVDALLDDGGSDGWRNADLPPDVDAYRAALAELADLGDLDEAAQDQALTELAAGRRTPSGSLSADQLARWFEDARVDLVSQWVAHPANLARIGFDGLATGGGDVPFLGFAQLGIGEREAWEPAMLSVVSS